jgi:hypothetical protein
MKIFPELTLRDVPALEGGRGSFRHMFVVIAPLAEHIEDISRPGLARVARLRRFGLVLLAS